jgi:hypothetical protein
MLMGLWGAVGDMTCAHQELSLSSSAAGYHYFYWGHGEHSFLRLLLGLRIHSQSRSGLPSVLVSSVEDLPPAATRLLADC